MPFSARASRCTPRPSAADCCTGSPCVAAGDPSVLPLGGESNSDKQVRAWDGDGDDVAIVGIGSDEATSFGVADLNGDGAVNAFDVDPFIVPLTGG